MGLPDLKGEVLGKLGHERRLERAGRDDDLVGDDRPPVELENEESVFLRKLAHVAAELDGKFEGLGVALEIGDHLVARRITVRLARQGQGRQRAVAAGREERQRVPALAPSRRDPIASLEDDEPAPLLS
jgi:hypothetical protein